MCGRTSHGHLTWAELRSWMLGITPSSSEIPDRFNVTPTMPVPIIRRLSGALVGDLAYWGLIPQSHGGRARDWKYKTFNARIETVAKSPSFAASYRGRRCTVLASGFYEWKRGGEVAVPHFIHPAGNAPALLFAGLWTEVDLDDYTGLTCTILTEPAAAPVAELHDRQPVMMTPESALDWMGGAPVEGVARLSVTAIAHHEVSRSVGNSRNDGPELQEPVSGR